MTEHDALLIVLLAPPAIFGIFFAVDWWIEELRIRRARRRHPAAREDHLPGPREMGLEDHPEWPFK